MDDRHRLRTDTDNGMLLIISGPSGVGKTTITRGVERTIADSVFSVSVTTRPKTDADVEGVDYHFVSDDQFESMRSDGALLESADVFGKKYGTPRKWVEEQLDRGRLVILEIDVDGAKQVKAAMPEAFALFILPPDEGELLRRLRDRKREDEDAIQRRFGEAQREMREARESEAYDSFLINHEVDAAIAGAVEQNQTERARRARRPADNLG
ncbi:MAG: guanylate kinase [Planctomycetota bacterium]